MKTNLLHNHCKTQPVTPEALVHIAVLAERDSRGCEERCAKHSRRSDILRTSVAACLFALMAFVADTAYANSPLYSGNMTSGTIDSTQANEMVIYILKNK